MDYKTLLLLSKIYKDILLEELSLYKHAISHKLLNKENIIASLL